MDKSLRKNNFHLHVKIEFVHVKLTLSIKKDIIVRAKVYAKENKTSLSFLIDNFLQKITSDIF